MRLEVPLVLLAALSRHTLVGARSIDDDLWHSHVGMFLITEILSVGLNSLCDYLPFYVHRALAHTCRQSHFFWRSVSDLHPNHM